jgi:hypothetical protein
MSFQITIQIPLISSVTVQTLLQEVLQDHNFRDSDNKQAFLQNFFNGRFPNTTQHFCLNLFFKKKTPPRWTSSQKKIICQSFNKPTTSEICTICLSKTHPNSAMLACGHVFHKKCILKSLEHKTTCPNCRSQIWLPEFKV